MPLLYNRRTMTGSSYIGRFAPSPTGPMHFGTLVAALASYLRARSQHGQWLVRMEDVDVYRKVEGADSAILQSLETFGFEWDGDVIYQTTRTDAYQAALQQLKQRQRLYPCTCSRKQLARQTGEWSPVYPGTCRNNTDWSLSDYSVRIKTEDDVIAFNDVLFGEHRQNLASEVGDFVIKRRDGVFAYQLAVVVDDAWQGVTEVVRGTDLIDSTVRQIFLQRELGLATPDYLHFPVVVDAHDNKLSKSTGADWVDNNKSIATLNAALRCLGQLPIDVDTLDDFWKQAIRQWDITAIPKRMAVHV